ncbi:mucin-associated surface protein [Pengzhenrongella frigida]|uniref:Mucin-associated surface protein n=1 Tax=Pengzhenrongella frigida TaxID=1259133 RepID=A0A4V1ZHM9_9MICO|nr:mucin-associated surface protein [Cellulomonas sp. HLT2-17]RYV52604.1 mucin-associated surface protein [Cellulomonas sp. HLT2-17]
MTHPTRPRTASTVGTLAAAALLAGLLSGCTPEPDLTPAAANQLQASVLEVSRAAAADDLPAARTALDALTGQLADERASGGLSPEREALIEAAIAAVSADLTALEDEAARVQAEAQAAADAAAADDAAAAQKAAAEQAADDAEDAKDRKKGNKDDD